MSHTYAFPGILKVSYAVKKSVKWIKFIGWDGLLPLFNTLIPIQNGLQFPDDIFKGILLNENVWVSLKISLTFVPKARINNIPALVQIRAYRGPGAKPLSEPMVVSLFTHICINWSQLIAIQCNVWYDISPWIVLCHVVPFSLCMLYQLIDTSTTQVVDNCSCCLVPGDLIKYKENSMLVLI